MDLSEYKTNDTNEVLVVNKGRLNNLLPVLFSIYFSFIVLHFLTGFVAIVWSSLPLFYAFTYVYKLFDGKIKLLANQNGVGYSSCFVDNLTLKTIKRIFEPGAATITRDGMGYKQGFFWWGEIASYQYVLSLPGDELTYSMFITPKFPVDPIVIALPINDDDEWFESIRASFDDLAKQHSIVNLGITQKQPSIDTLPKGFTHINPNFKVEGESGFFKKTKHSLTINNIGITHNDVLYRWETIARFHILITICTKSSGKRSYFSTKNTLVLTEKEEGISHSIDFPESWDKSASMIYDALKDFTSGTGVEDGGFVKE